MGEYITRPEKARESQLADFEVRLSTNWTYTLNAKPRFGTTQTQEFTPPDSCSDTHLNALRFYMPRDNYGGRQFIIKGNDSPFGR